MRMKMTHTKIAPSLLLLLLSIHLRDALGEEDTQGPEFVTEPPNYIDFSNTTGAILECSAKGVPMPTVSWVQVDGSPATNVSGLRQTLPEGKLVFLPFRAEDYRQDIHAVHYRCLSSNSVGSIVSREVQVKAILLQMYDVHVYDTYVISGNTGVLKCHIPSVLSEYVKVISWTRDETYIISSSNNKVEPDAKYIIMPNGDLHIRNARNSDATSRFRCQTNNRLTGQRRASITTGRLFVTDPKGTVPPRITDTVSSIRIKQGEILMIPCVAHGNPAPTFKWFVKPHHDGQHPVHLGDRAYQAASNLVLMDPQISDGGTYICEAYNNVGSERAETFVIVTAPLSARVEPRIFVADEKEAAVFKCYVTGYPVSSIVWMKNGRHMKTVGQNVSHYTELRIKQVDLESRGMYQCIVKNNYESVQAASELRLKDAVPVIRYGFEEKISQPGPGLFLKCIVAGSPPPKITWTLDDIPIDSNRDRFIVSTFTNTSGDVVGTLNISSTRTEDGGLYRCIASNKAGSAEHSTRINIYGKPSVRKTPKLSVVAGDDIWIHCPMYGFPIDNITWEKGRDYDKEYNGKSLPFDLRQSLFRNGTVKIVNVQRGVDSGRYTCFVRNKHGQGAKEDKQLVVMVPPKIIPFAFKEDQFYIGMRAHITCSMSEGDLPIKFKWLKDRKPIPVSLGVDVHRYDKYTSSLNIESISSWHSGNYTCIISNNASTMAHTAQLLVQVAPKIVPFSFLGDYLYEGGEARVSCVISQGDLPITIEWKKDGHFLPHNLGVSIRVVDDYSSLLTIENVQRVHSGNYTCVAKNSASPTEYTTHLAVNVPPKITPFSFQNDKLFAGMLARVSCVISQGDYPINITWKKDNMQIKSNLGVNTVMFDEQSSILSIDSVAEKHNGNYTCIARNDAGKASHFALLRVNVPPRWIIEPRDVKVVVGEQSILNCSADGFPTPIITWTKVEGFGEDERKELIHSSSHMHVFNNGSLFLKRIRLEDKGLYFCQATNGIGGGLSTPVQIHVHSPPQFEVRYRNQTVRKGDSFEVPCEAKGDNPISIMWMKTGEGRIGLQADSRYAVKEGSVADAPVSHLHVMAADRSDTAIFTCVAENAFGRDEANINIIVQEPPDSPTNISVGNIESRALVVSWIPPFDGNSRITKYVVQYQTPEGNWQEKVQEISVNGKEVTAQVNGLSPAASYKFRVLAENMLGISPAGYSVNVTMAEEAPQGPPEHVKVEAINPQTLKVTWKPPKREQWNGRIRGYNIGHRIINSNDPAYVYKTVELDELIGEDLLTFITNLKKFTQYGVVVLAYNDVGKGPLSQEVIAMTSEDVPSKPPQELRCTTLTSQNMHVTWQPPPPDGMNGILRGYKVFYKPIKEWYDDTTVQKRTSGQKITLQELEKFVNYSIQVLAFTRMGDGVLSPPSFCRTLDDVPSQPADIKAIPTSATSIIVGWKAPEEPNGIVKQYTLYRKIPGQRLENAVKYVVPASSLSYEVTGLKKSQRYEFWVTASTTVGEGPSSAVVTQTPNGSIVAARALSFHEKVLTAWKSSVKLPCEAVGMPTPDKKWIINGDHVQLKERIRVLKDGSLHFENIQKSDAGNYSCIVQNGFGDDNVTYALVVLVPPAAPILEVISTTSITVDISWNLPDDGGIRIQGYTLNVKREFGQWEQINLPSDVRSYTLQELECGTRYHLYLFAFNRVGMGSPSEVIVASTQGSIPNIPPKEAVIEEGVNSVSLNLYAWKNEECPIQYFVVEYKAQASVEWSFVSNNIKPEQKKLVVPGLNPATRYDLRMTAHNTAGSNIASYRFATLKLDGGTVEPEIERIEYSGSMTFFSDLRIIVPLSISIAAVLIILVVMCLCLRRRKGTERRRVKAVSGFPPRDHSGHSFIKKHANHQHKIKQKLIKKSMSKKERAGHFKATPRTPAPEYDPPPIPGTEDGYNLSRIQMLHPVHGPSTGCGSPSFLRGLRVVHPSAVPTAPPLSETSSLAYDTQPRRSQESPGADPRFSRQSGATRGQPVARRPGSYPNANFSGPSIVTEETTFVFPTSYQDGMNYSEVVDAERDRRRGQGFDNRHSRAADPVEVTGLLQRPPCF